MGRFSIKDLEKISGIKAHTIRIWEKRYGLIQPCRTSTNIRYYNDSELRRLMNISILLKNGFKISHIARLPETELGEMVLMLTQQTGKTDELIENLVMATLEYDENKFNHIFSSYVLKFGFEETIIGLIVPLMHRFDMLLQTSAILNTQVQFAYHIIRQHVLVAIGSQSDKIFQNPPKFAIFSLESESNELPLLFSNYILRKRGFNTLYFGKKPSSHDLEKMLQQIKIDCIVSVINPPGITELALQFLNKINQVFNGTIYLINNSFSAEVNVLPLSVKHFQSFKEFSESLNLQHAEQ